MELSFNKPEVQHECNNRKYCDYLKTVEKFIYTYHMFFLRKRIANRVKSIQRPRLIVNRGQSWARMYPGIESNVKPASSTNKSENTSFPSTLIFIVILRVYHTLFDASALSYNFIGHCVFCFRYASYKSVNCAGSFLSSAKSSCNSLWNRSLVTSL